MLGRLDHELFPPDTADEILERDRRVMTSGEAQTIEETRTMRGVDPELPLDPGRVPRPQDR